MNTVNIKSVRSDGLTFEYNTDMWGIFNLDGIDAPELEVFTQNVGFGNGTIITGKRKSSREIEVGASMKLYPANSFDRNSERERVIAFHNSNYTYTLEITYMGRTRLAKGCVILDLDIPTRNIYEPLEISITYLCPDSDLLEDVETSTLFKQDIPMWHVERFYKPDKPLTFTNRIHAVEKEIYYTGSEPAPLHFRITALGLVENLDIKVNGVLFEVTATMTEGDVVEIDVAERLVTLNGRPMKPSEYTALTLLLLELEFGKNVIRITPDDPDNLFIDPVVTYTGRYGGL